MRNNINNPIDDVLVPNELSYNLRDLINLPVFNSNVDLLQHYIDKCDFKNAIHTATKIGNAGLLDEVKRLEYDHDFIFNY
jgi:hypothetical protein